MYPYVITGDSVVVTVKGKPTTVQRGAPNYQPLKEALEAKDWDRVDQFLTVTSSVAQWSKGNFKVNKQTVTYRGEVLPQAITNRILRTAAAGESPEPLFKFWEKLQQNPSMRSVEQLYPFLEHQGIPIIENGNFLAYKGVKRNFTDAHTGKVDNRPGTVNRMPRNKISDDPQEPCHYGFHVGALGYAQGFSEIVIVCEVNPADVVCIPYDHSMQKMRVCEYISRGVHNGELLPSTTYQLDLDIGKGTEFEPEEEELETSGYPHSYEDIAKIEKAKRLPRKAKKKLKAKPAAKPQPVERKLKQPRADEHRLKLKVPPEFRAIHKAKTLVDLWEYPIGELRSYAARVLHMVGASKIPGGKVTLINRILKVRDSFA